MIFLTFIFFLREILKSFVTLFKGAKTLYSIDPKNQEITITMDSQLLNITLDCENAIFTMAMHPAKNQMLIGFSTGHVCCIEYNITENNKIKMVFNKIGKEFKYTLFNEDDDEIEASDIPQYVNLLWKTKRHEKSCRNVIYLDEKTAVSVGSDNHMKLFKSENGKILDKYYFEDLEKLQVKPNCLFAFNEYILMGTEEKGIVKVMKYDSQYKLEMFNELVGLHNGDSINKIEALSKSNYKRVIKKAGKNKVQDEFITEGLSIHKFISVGQTTVQIWDCRWKDITKVQSSEDQEDELLSLCFLNDDENDSTLFCGQGQGVLTFWQYGLNEYNDQIGRIKISKNEGIESLMPTMLNNNRIWCGCTDGFVYLLDGKVKRIVKKVHHGKYEDVSLLDIDYEYRLVSGSMNTIKVWNIDQEEEEMSNASMEDDSSDDSQSSSDDESDSLSGDEEDESNSDDEAIASFKKSMEEKPLNIQVQEIKMSNKDIKKISKKQQKKQQQELKRKEESLKHGIRKFEGL